MRKAKIYTLEHPKTGEIRYVGKTCRDLAKRLSEHCSRSNGNHGTHKINWIDSLRKQGLKPVIKTLENCSIETCEELEKYWIEQFKAWGFRLVNGCDYGPGIVGRKVHEETLDKFRKPLVCWDAEGNIIGIFKGSKTAAKELNIGASHIPSVAKGKRASVEGYRFKYYMGETIIIDQIEPYKKKSSRGKQVHQYNLEGDFIASFKSCVEAALFVDGSHSNINAVARPNSREKSYRQFVWKYTKD